jgi:hypothetical protein
MGAEKCASGAPGQTVTVGGAVHVCADVFNLAARSESIGKGQKIPWTADAYYGTILRLESSLKPSGTGLNLPLVGDL